MDNVEPIVKKKSSRGVIIAVIVIAVVAIGAFIFSRPSTKDEAMLAEKEAMEQKAMMEKDKMQDEGMVKKDEMMKDGGTGMEKDSMMTNGSYEVYSPEKLAWAKDGKVVLFFKASWCPSCNAVDADIKSHLSAIPKGTHILEVDYDKSADLKKKYGVTYQHTFVQVDQNGVQLAKWSGSSTLVSLIANIK